LKPLTYLLVDFENGQPPATDVARVRGDEYRLWVFHGPHQNKFAAEMVVAWQPLGDRVRFVQSAKSGKNALDFHLSFYLGVLHHENSAANRPATYVVVTKDGGFDALFEHMRALGCVVGKAPTIPEALALAGALRPDTPKPSAVSAGLARPSRGIIPPLTPPVPKSAPKAAAAKADPARRKTMVATDPEKVIADLRLHPRNRPSDRPALERHVVSVLGNKVTVRVSRVVIKDLEQRNVVKFVDGGKIEYRIPKAK
jgi:hypothetical protein